MALLESVTVSSVTFWLLVSFFIYSVTLVSYRIFLSPLAKFPGPKIAAATLWYEFYYDVILQGQYTFHIKELHEKYGPIIRINPHELHIADAEYYDTLYASSASGEKRNKWGWYTKQFGTPEAMFATNSHDLHKSRRAALNRFFSMASVRRLQPLLEARVDQLMARFREAKKTGVIVPLDYAFAALTNDVVIEYAYGESEHRLAHPAWGPEYHDAIVEAGRAGSMMKQIFLLDLISSLPVSVQSKLSPSMELVLRIQYHVEEIITRIKSQPKITTDENTHPTLFHEIIANPNLPDSEKTVSRLKDEALIVVGAGTLTTSWALSVAAYHLLASPRILSKLKAELRSAIPDKNTHVALPELERLPYLTGVVQEALRLSYGVSSRLQRISPDKALIYSDPDGQHWEIPAGTPVGMTSVLQHHNESIFPDSKSFSPERWLDNPRLEKYLVSFSKGSRQCLGINLAYAEMYLCLATLFRRFGSVALREAGGGDGNEDGWLELYETGIRDVEIHADGFVPLPVSGSKGVRMRVVD